jgi:hypothetical protein
MRLPVVIHSEKQLLGVGVKVVPSRCYNSVYDSTNSILKTLRIMPPGQKYVFFSGFLWQTEGSKRYEFPLYLKTEDPLFHFSLYVNNEEAGPLFSLG